MRLGSPVNTLPFPIEPARAIAHPDNPGFPDHEVDLMDLQAFLDAYGPLLIEYAVSLAGALVLLIVAFLAAGWARRVTTRGLQRASFDATLTKFFATLARYTVLIVAVLAVLGIFGVQTTSFAAVIAAAGLAIGLAFQGTLSSFSAGVMLLTFRPFKVGDFVEVGGESGTVFEIELFTTQLDTPDNRRLIIPNSSVFGSTIENVTYHPIRRVDVAVGTDYPADLAATRQVLEAAAARHHQEIEGKDPQVMLLELGDSAISWTVRVWAKTEDYWTVRDALTTDVKNSLDDAGIGIPYPQMDIHMDGALQKSTTASP